MLTHFNTSIEISLTWLKSNFSLYTAIIPFTARFWEEKNNFHHKNPKQQNINICAASIKSWKHISDTGHQPRFFFPIYLQSLRHLPGIQMVPILWFRQEHKKRSTPTCGDFVGWFLPQFRVIFHQVGIPNLIWGLWIRQGVWHHKSEATTMGCRNIILPTPKGYICYSNTKS